MRYAILLTLIAGMLAVVPAPATLAATSTVEVQTVPMAHDAFTLTPATPTMTRSLVIDSAPEVTIMVTAVSKTLTVALVSPGGARRVVGDPDTTTFTSGVIPDLVDPTRSGANYAMVLDQPASGTYTLEVTETSTLSAPLDVVVTTLFENATRALLVGGGETYPLGSDVRLSMVALDALGKVHSATATGRVSNRDDATIPPVTVTFSDDGTGADQVAGDGVYSAFVHPTAGGSWGVEGSIAGTASSGAFKRTAFARFNVVARRAQLDGTFAERTIDLDGDTLIDRVGIAPRASVLEAGVYDITVRLHSSNGNVLQRTVRATLAAGAAAPEVQFATADIANGLGVDGPYQLEMARYDRVLGSEVAIADLRYDLGNTAAYQLGTFEHERLRVIGGSSTGVDYDGNGRYDRLDVSLVIAADFAGGYSWSGSLSDSTGHELGFRTGGIYVMTPGQQTIVMSFDGHTIGENGVDGPYNLSNFLMYGAGQSLVAPVAYSTIAYKASQFEGYTRDVTPPTLSVSVTPNDLWPVDHKMVEITPTIVVSDDFDPAPVVALLSITSNEGDDARGDGSTSPDILVDNGRIFLRAERSGLDPGRTYTLTWRATDMSGNSSTATATVTVAHDQGKK